MDHMEAHVPLGPTEVEVMWLLQFPRFRWAIHQSLLAPKRHGHVAGLPSRIHTASTIALPDVEQSLCQAGLARMQGIGDDIGFLNVDDDMGILAATGLPGSSRME